METVSELPGSWVFDGDVYGSYCLEQDLLHIRDKQKFYADDILVATYPKAGTTWMQEVVWCLVNGPHAVNSREDSLDDVFPFIEERLPATSGLEKVSRLPKPRLIKTHLQAKFFTRSLESETGCPRIILVIRNPKDVYVSYLHFINSVRGCKFTDWDNFFRLIEANKVPYGDYFAHLRGWAKYRDHPNLHIVKYEDMKSDPMIAIQNIADFLGIMVTKETLDAIVAVTSFASMKSRPPEKYFTAHQKGLDFTGFFRKGESGGWKQTMNEEQSKYFDDRMVSELNPVGFTWE